MGLCRPGDVIDAVEIIESRFDPGGAFLLLDNEEPLTGTSGGVHSVGWGDPIRKPSRVLPKSCTGLISLERPEPAAPSFTGGAITLPG